MISSEAKKRRAPRREEKKKKSYTNASCEASQEDQAKPELLLISN